MVRMWGLVKGYTPVKVHSPEGNNVKINIKTDLLSPIGKTIVGTLQFNGTTVYIPKDDNITIGRSPKCQIRLLDPAVEPFHATISSMEENVTIEHIWSSGKTAILSSSKAIKTIGIDDQPSTLANGDKVVFKLSGENNLLRVDFKLRQPFEADIQQLLVEQLQPRPKIEQVSVEQASTRQAIVKVEDQPLPVKALVAETPFAICRTIDDVLTLYPDKLEKARKKDLSGFFISSLLCSGVNLAMAFFAFDNIFTPALLITYLVTAVSFPAIMNFIIASSKAHLNKSLAKILSQSDTNKVAHALAKVSTDEGDMVLSVLEKYDPTAADAIRLRLPREAKLASKAQKVTPELPPVRVRVEPPALPSTHTRIAEQSAEEEVVAQEETRGISRSKAE